MSAVTGRLPAWRGPWAMVWLAAALCLLPAASAWAADGISLFGSTTKGAQTEFTVKTQVLVIMTLLGLLPVLMLMMTSFVRFVIVLSLLRQALGLQQGLPNRIVT
ncbi:MAG: lfiP, partial [Rhodoferax sp.]|nr:lfiP [Rhodoferax sp.]